MSNNQNLGLLYKMALIQKSNDKDSYDAYRIKSQDEDQTDYFNILKKYMKRIPKKTNRYIANVILFYIIILKSILMLYIHIIK